MDMFRTTRRNDAVHNKAFPRTAAVSLSLVLFFLPPIVLAEPVRLYDQEPEHLWNRLHRALFIRTSATGEEFGHDNLNVLLWPNTSAHLLSGESRKAGIALLKEFLEKDGEKLVTDPVQRAMLQRDLWGAFDWAAEPNFVFRSKDSAPAVREFIPLLARAIERVAMSAAEIGKLPNTYAEAVASKSWPGAFDKANPQAPFLPPELMDPQGPWVCLGEAVSTQGRVYTKLVPQHVREFSRSTFAVFLRLPQGRAAAEKYLQQLNQFATPWKVDGRRISIHDDLPPFPDGTQLALMRCAMLVDATGAIVPTRIVESLQFRTFRGGGEKQSATRQYVLEFVLTRARSGKSSVRIRPIESGERGFDEFGSFSDPFEERSSGEPRNIFQRVVYESCVGCHHDPGVHGFNTFTRTFGPQTTIPPTLVVSTLKERDEAAVYWKQTQYDWGLLTGILRSR